MGWRGRLADLIASDEPGSCCAIPWVVSPVQGEGTTANRARLSAGWGDRADQRPDVSGYDASFIADKTSGWDNRLAPRCVHVVMRVVHDLVMSRVVLRLVLSTVVAGCSGAPALPRAQPIGDPTATAVSTAKPTTTANATPSPSDTPVVTPSPEPIGFLPLGDSYTIGTSVDESERWPNQLVELLGDRVPLRLVANPAVNGYTSADLIRDELDLVDVHRPGLVGVLIGVNDVVRGVPEERYRANVAQILDHLVERVGAGRVFAVATPDYTLTPAGADYGDPETNRAAIERFNAILQMEAEERHIAFVDITPVANRAGTDSSLVARDGLHPSGRQYLAWAELIEPVVEEMLSGE